MNRLRLLHLSDLHIARRYSKFGSSSRKYILEEIARFSYLRKKNIDGILISGDIADFGKQHDLECAKEFIFSPPQIKSTKPWLNYYNRPTLQACEKPIILIPGNHDRFSILCRPDIKMFDSIFFDSWKPIQNRIQLTLLPNDKNYSLAVVSADFCLRQIDDNSIIGGYLGQGKVYGNRLAELIRQTKKINSNSLAKVLWMVHFAPEFENHLELSYIDKRYLKLIDSQRLIEAAKNLKVRHIFCGHIHYNKNPFNAGDSTDACWIHYAGTAACHKDMDGYESSVYIREIDGSNRNNVKVKSLPFIWNSKEGKFLI